MNKQEYILDITNEHCPMTLVKSRLKIESLKKNEIIRILIKEENVFLSLVQSFKDLDLNILKTLVNSDNIFEIIIKK